MNHYVYEITNLINGRKYIGKRSCHCPIEDDKYMGSGKILKEALKKYGKENFKKEILQICENEEMAYEWEKVYIEQVKAYENSLYYNIVKGGEGFTSEENAKLWENPEYRKMQSEKAKKQFKEFWKDEEYRNKHTLRLKRLWDKESHRNKMSIYSKLRWENPEFRKKHSELMKKLWENKDYRENMRNVSSSIMTNNWKSPTFKIKMSEAMRIRWQDSDYREYMTSINSEQLKKQWESPEFRKMRSEASKKLWENPEYRKMQSEKAKKLWENPEFRKNQEKLKAERWENPEFRKMQSELMKKRMSDKDFKEKQRKAIKEKWQDAEFRKMQSEKAKKQFKEFWKDEEYRRKVLEPRFKKVILLNTLQEFTSIKEATKFIGLVESTGIIKCCKGTQAYAGKVNGEPAKWMYYEDYIKKTEEEVQNILNEHIKFKGSKQVICLNTLKVFNSIKEASDITSIDKSCIQACCSKKRKSAGKVNGEPAKWMYYEDYLKQLGE